MGDLDPKIVRQIAESELRQEALRAAVEAEKQRILAHRGRNLWQRIVDRLPFTITIDRKPK